MCANFAMGIYNFISCLFHTMHVNAVKKERIKNSRV